MTTKYVFSTADTRRYRFSTHTNELIMDRADATTSEAFLTVLEPGEQPPLHVHHDTEQIFYMLRGAGTLQIGDNPPQRFPIKPGDLIRVPPHTFHLVRNDGPEPIVYLSVDCFVGGKPEGEPTWDSHVRVTCEKEGWDFDQIHAR